VAPNTATFRIGLLGPTRVGKTSLVTALLAQSQDLLAGSGVAMRPVGLPTEDKIAKNQADLEGDLLAGEFRPESLKSTTEPFTFTLELDPGVPGAEIGIELLDFPGGWISGGQRPAQAASDWDNCKRFIADSTILLIPVDAALLMEAVSIEHKRAIPRLLTTPEVKQVARNWAIERNRRSNEPALVAFCPVKCESYFKDNGGRADKSVDLRRKFLDVYDETLEAVRAEAPKAVLLYAPVDTLGCVERIDASWGVNPDTQELELLADYRVRRPARISRVGADNVMRALCRQLVQGRRMLSAIESEDLHQLADQAHQYAVQREGFFRDIWLWLNQERAARQRAALSRDQDAQEASRRVAALDAVLDKIAMARYGPRAQEL
jgi:hypothetical protein